MRLVASVDADDQFHKKCVAALKGLREPLVTVWPPVTEAMYLLADLHKAACPIKRRECIGKCPQFNGFYVAVVVDVRPAD